MTGSCVIIYSNFGPYHIARLCALAKILPATYAIEIASNQKIYPWRPDKEHLEFQSKTLFAARSFESVPIGQQCKAIKEALSKISPEIVVVAGYGKLVMRAAANWAKKQGVPSILLFSSTYFDHPRKWWKEFVKRILIKQYFAVAATGQRAFDYAHQLGTPRNRIFKVGNVVDNTHFLNAHKSLNENKDSTRKRLNLPEQYFLAVSRLSKEKNYSVLLNAFKEYRKQGGKWDLVVVGGGPQEQQLLNMVELYRIPGVCFVGWQSYGDLPIYYALACCFILPSLSEPWGLVVNEAMACGLPVLVSKRCGCMPELCRPGENGYDFDPCDTDEIVGLMLRVSSGKVDLRVMGEVSRRIVSNFTPKTWARKLKNCIDAALK